VAINVGTLALDGVATPFEIALILPITGATDADATASCVYYKVNTGSPSSLGEEGAHLTGHPLYRIRTDLQSGTGIEDAFAWTIIDLDPNSTYKIDVTVSSAGDSNVDKTLTTTTRKLPSRAPFPVATIATGTSTANIKTAIEALTAGQCIQFDDGTHTLAGLTLSLSAGTPTAPLYIRGTTRTGTILVDTTGVVLDLLTCDNVVIENLTIVGSETDSGTAASSRAIRLNPSNTQSNITVRNITAYGIDQFVVTEDHDVTGVLVYECVAVGNNRWESAFIDSNATWNDACLQLSGNGNSGWGNTFKNFGDTFAVTYTGATSTFNCHYHHNDVRNSCDDLIEFDDALRNITFHDNVSHNSMTFFSVDSVLGGPILIARNIAHNIGRGQVIKAGGPNTGWFAYNNTITTSQPAGAPPASGGLYQPGGAGDQQSYGYRNNLLVHRGTVSSIVWLDSTDHDPIDFTNNAWYLGSGGASAYHWVSNGYSSPSAAAAGLGATTPIFSGQTQRHTNDEVTVSNPWSVTITLGSSYTDEVSVQPYPTPNHAGVVDQGVAIPNITPAGDSTPNIGAAMDGFVQPIYGNTVPSWVKTMSVNDWLQLTNSGSVMGNTMTDNGSFIAWNSFAVDPVRSAVFSVANGGHGDWSGNEVFRFDAFSEVPSWSRPLPSTVNPDSDVEYQPDGRPTSRHSYYGSAFNEFDDRIMLATGAPYGSGFPGLPTTDSYNIGANSYNAEGTHPNVPTGHAGFDRPFCIDPFTGDLYSPYGFATPSRLRRSDNTWVSLGSGPEPEGGAASSAWDTKRNRLIVIGGGTDESHHYYDVGAGTWSTITLTGALASTVENLGQAGMVYVPSLDAILMREASAGATVYKVDAETFACSSLSTSGGTGIENPHAGDNGGGPYNKFLYLPKLGCCVYFDDYTEGPWFLKVEDADPAIPGESGGEPPPDEGGGGIALNESAWLGTLERQTNPLRISRW